MKKIFYDSKGKLSSKRVAGLISVIIGVILGIVLFYYAIIKDIKNSETAISIFYAFMGFGTGALGLGVFERKED